MELRVSTDRASTELLDSVLFYTVTNLYITVPFIQNAPFLQLPDKLWLSPQNLLRPHLQSQTVADSFIAINKSFFNNMWDKTYYCFLLAHVGSMTQKSLWLLWSTKLYNGLAKIHTVTFLISPFWLCFTPIRPSLLLHGSHCISIMLFPFHLLYYSISS